MKTRCFHVRPQILGVVLSAFAALILGGCESTKPLQAPASMNAEVPAAMMYQKTWHGARPMALATDILPSSEAEMFYVPRFYPVAYGPVQMGGASAYRIYTYDSQAISTLGNTGWRTRYVLQTGMTVP